MKTLDDVPYAVLGAIFAAVCFFIGNLVFYRSLWQLLVAPMVGALLGLITGIQVARSKKLRPFATLREFKAGTGE
ncbi:MAG TPA: hypothetical protein VJS63_13280 [Bradyrhizobium sp.]|nr:hypothetical protein [Bradyrhizobium sp.]